MDVRDRALLDLKQILDVSPPVTPRFHPEEARYLSFKALVQSRLRSALTDAGAVRFLEQWFIELLPILLRSAAQHEKLDLVECAAERALLAEVLANKRGHLSHSPMIFPVNHNAFRSILPAAPSLDLGIGNGQNSRFSLGGRKLDVGADIIVSNLLKARTEGVHDRYVALDVGAIPFSDDTFQRVYALNCIYHIQAGRRVALNEMARVLAPGGILALTDVSPHLSEFKPLAHFFDALGFKELTADFTRYFLGGYGADGSAGEGSWYREALAELGFEDIEVRYILSPRLCHLAYLFYDWQALFNFDAQSSLEGEGDARYLTTYQPMLMDVVAPLIGLDEALCRQEGRGGYLFVSARKKGQLRPFLGDLEERLVCPATRSRLIRSRTNFFSSEGRRYPIIEGIPLLTEFYADAVAGQSG